MVVAVRSKALTTKRTVRTAAPKSVRPAAGFRTDIKRADYVSAFARGLELLKVFDHDTPRLSVSVAAARTGLSRAAARRFLLTLCELGYATATDEWFELRPTVLELGYSFLSTWRTPELVTPFLREGVKVMNENVSFGVLDGHDAVYIARVEARRLVQSLVITIGSRVPAVLSAMGRVLLASQPPEVIAAVVDQTPLPRLTPASVASPRKLRAILQEVHEQGWCVVTQEFEEGVSSLAVPIHGPGGEVMGAINVGAPVTRVPAGEMASRLLPPLQQVAANISHAVRMSGLR